MNKIKYFIGIFTFLIVLPCFSQAEDKNIIKDGDRPICLATTINDSSKIIKNPGNCPIEILRRLGRAISQHWPENKSIIKTGSLIYNEFVGTPNFIKVFSEEKLSESQKKTCEELINSHLEKINNLLKEFNPSSEAITLRFAMNVCEIQKTLKNIINNEEKLTITIPKTEIDNIKKTLLPIVEAFSDCYAVLSLSEKGIFGRVNAESTEGKFSNIISTKNITIKNFIDSEPLIVMAQTHTKEEPSMVMKKLESIPNMAVINQIIASAGLDFEKDLIENYAEESIFYLNLTPTGEKLIPDIRWVTLVPNINKLNDILPKLKNLCVQIGIFITPIKSPIANTDIVKLSHFMLKDYGIYATIIDKFCILSSTEEGSIKSLQQINKAKNSNSSENIPDCNFYFRIRTSDLNVQLQQFLQSPMLRDKGIPPITNLTFLNDMNDIKIHSEMDKENIKIFFDIPFKEKK